MTERYPNDEIDRLLRDIVCERPYPRAPQSEPELSWSYDVPAGSRLIPDCLLPCPDRVECTTNQKAGRGHGTISEQTYDLLLRVEIHTHGGG